MTRVAIVGATGYSGGELTALLARHPRAEVVGLFGSGSGKAVPVAVHPTLRGRALPTVAPFSVDAALAASPGAVFLATPHELSAEVARPLLEAGVKVIDLSGAFRLASGSDYERHYGFTHPAPELLDEAVYGLTEWTDGALEGARLVANPGCYPTTVLLALKPVLDLLAAGAPIVADAKSGVSGAGKKSDIAFSFSELSGNFKAYGVGKHRHEPEMRQRLGLHAGADFVFVPHLLPIVRGMLTTLHVSFSSPVSEEALVSRYAAAYGTAPFVNVRVPGELPEIAEVVNTPRCDIGFVVLPGGRRAVIVSALDNLLKGAASQAVQNFNRVFGFAEEEGLS